MRWLLDAMLSPAAAEELRRLGHDAVSVLDVGMGSADDSDVFDLAVRENRVVVTENFADFAGLLDERNASAAGNVPVVFVRRDALPKRGALPVHLARKLDGWSTANPDPFIGLYWP
ncbi:MAG: DUF5615 family PIN-like protein [Acidimicrobiales bacterium]